MCLCCLFYRPFGIYSLLSSVFGLHQLLREISASTCGAGSAQFVHVNKTAACEGAKLDQESNESEPKH